MNAKERKKIKTLASYCLRKIRKTELNLIF